MDATNPTRMRVGFFLTVTTFWLFTHIYVGWRLVKPSGLAGWRRLAVWGPLALSFGLTPATFFAMSHSGQAFADALQWLGFLSMGLFSLVLVGMWLRDLAWLALLLVDRVVATPLRDPARRGFLANALNLGVLAVSGAMAGLGYSQAVQDPDLEEHEVPVEGLDPALDGFTIVQISDVHVGPTVRGPVLERVVAAINALEPDLVAVTGDLVDGQVSGIGPHIRALADLRATHGAFFVTGNHEYYSGWEPWAKLVQSLGVEVLLDEHRVLDHAGAALIVGGVTDHSAARTQPDHLGDAVLAFDGAPAGFRLLLAHQPRSYELALEAAVDLQISGHTHGGQYFPFTALIHLAQPFSQGLHRVADRMWLYVNRGTTYWGPPIRLGAPQEITKLVLRRA